MCLSAETRETDNAARRAARHSLGDDFRRAGAFDDDVELDAGMLEMVSCAELADEPGLRPVVVAIEHMYLEPALHAHERGHQADRSGAGDEHALRRPARAPADALDVLPRLGEDARGLEQHCGEAERRVHLDGELGLVAPALGSKAVGLLDATLGIAAVPAHVPLAERAVHARHGVRMAHDADHDVAGAKAALGGRLDDAAERL